MQKCNKRCVEEQIQVVCVIGGWKMYRSPGKVVQKLLLKKIMNPVRDIYLSWSFQVGVNGYGFAINNNGFVLFHPGLNKEVIMSTFFYY